MVFQIGDFRDFENSGYQIYSENQAIINFEISKTIDLKNYFCWFDFPTIEKHHTLALEKNSVWKNYLIFWKESSKVFFLTNWILSCWTESAQELTEYAKISDFIIIGSVCARVVYKNVR